MLFRFLQDRRGTVAQIFGLSMFPLVGVVGAAVDYSRATQVRTGMQAALDATALSLSFDAPGMLDSDMQAAAQTIFNANFHQPNAKSVNVSAVLTQPQEGSFNLVVTSTATIKTTIAEVLTQQPIPVSSSATVKWGIKKLELALALDNTGSMAQSGKLAALKTAAKNLLTVLKNASKKPGDIKVAIVPFATVVNIGTGFKDQFWVDYSVNNIQKANWTGCVIDRDQNNDVLDTPPSNGSSSTYFPAATNASCGAIAQAMPLSEDWPALNSKIDAMAASGNTNVTIGLAWGWHALTNNAPFPEGAPAAPDLDKVIVMLTDGTNTQNRWTNSSNSIDARTQKVCDNIKAANIKLYTIRVINGNAGLLQGCATKPSMYYEVQNASQLNNVFTSIAQNLANLRIAQ
jgi:Flp pilus assembly protein TadG